MTQIFKLLLIVLGLTLPVQSLCAQSTAYVAYPEAYKEFTTVDKPMLLIVTATWCTACTDLKNRLEGLNRPSGLSVVLVDFDRENTLAKSLLREAKTIPHVVLFYKDKIKGDGQAMRCSNPSTSRLRSLINDARIKYPPKNNQTSGSEKPWR